MTKQEFQDALAKIRELWPGARKLTDQQSIQWWRMFGKEHYLRFHGAIERCYELATNDRPPLPSAIIAALDAIKQGEWGRVKERRGDAIPEAADKECGTVGEARERAQIMSMAYRAIDLGLMTINRERYGFIPDLDQWVEADRPELWCPAMSWLMDAYVRGLQRKDDPLAVENELRAVRLRLESMVDSHRTATPAPPAPPRERDEMATVGAVIEEELPF